VVDNELGFYATAAQVIPVLWLVIVFEGRALSRNLIRAAERSAVTYRASILLFTTASVVGLVGELIALDALREGKRTDFTLWFVYLSLIFQVAWIAIGLVLTLIPRTVRGVGPGDRDEDREEEDDWPAID